MPLRLFQSPHQCLGVPHLQGSTVDFSVSPGEPDLKQPLASRCDNCITSGGDSSWDSSMALSPGWCKMGPDRSMNGLRGQQALWRTNWQNNNPQEKRKCLYSETEA